MGKLPEIGRYDVEVFEQDGYIIETWSKNDMHHRVGGPAVTYYDKATGKPVIQVYKEHGIVHRDNGPAHIQINPENDIVHLEEHYQNGNLHRIGYAALIVSNPNTGQIKKAHSYENGVRVFKSHPIGGLGCEGFEI